jgi:hypothetical protein
MIQRSDRRQLRLHYERDRRRQVDGPGGQWEIAGESLTDKDYCNVEQTHSKTQGRDVYGNLCTDCGAYQGNH